MSAETPNGRRLALAASYALLSYLYGSVPFVALLAKKKNIDLKKTGSKNVGAANLFQSTKSPALALSGWLADLSKGALPPLLAKTILPIEDEKTEEILACSGATAGVAGQCWPIFLSFSGGRGVAPLIGASLMLAPGLVPYLFAAMTAGGSLRAVPLLIESGDKDLRQKMLLEGKNSRAVPLCVGLSIAAFPAAMLLRGYPKSRVAAASANALILFSRRVTAGGIPKGPGKARKLLNRLLYDRSEV
ncbi:glycerol-3-phosphate acyltransferase [Rubrobacter naiadicus]|uniref:glycerol-3-phosphate acyltransferase n=1 Tax=Rubrobacter naiadicus TaxID=1392641 RepID=UPI002361F725|nr:glycerol-3-phosphate acyltransferase [Rubrobacter naiadicus]